MNAFYCYRSSLLTTVGSVTPASPLVGRCMGFPGAMFRYYLCRVDLDSHLASTCVLLQSYIPKCYGFFLFCSIMQVIILGTCRKNHILFRLG